MLIQVLGIGCPRCRQMEIDVRAVVAWLGLVAQILMIKDVMEIIRDHVFVLPALVVDGQVVVFDIAPTGHTLRLLELPIDWSKQLDVKVFASVDTEAADDVAKRRFQQVIEMMRDGDRSTFAFVMYPESTPVLEAYRAVEELRTAGIEPGFTVANFIIPPDQADNPFVRARRAIQAAYLQDIQTRFPVPMIEIPLLPEEVRGMDALEALGAQIFDPLVVGEGL